VTHVADSAVDRTVVDASPENVAAAQVAAAEAKILSTEIAVAATNKLRTRWQSYLCLPLLQAFAGIVLSSGACRGGDEDEAPKVEATLVCGLRQRVARCPLSFGPSSASRVACFHFKPQLAPVAMCDERDILSSLRTKVDDSRPSLHFGWTDPT
jgi:hypothetical protein